ncbi:MAG: ABC transporter permease [FCB group bacterium]|nr:ABC transporter permease [FCB group bacterium]
MTFADIISISFGNLWRMKLRSFLTISGVVIGIAALVSMMSFGAGMQRNVSDSLKSMALFNTLQVLPGGMIEAADGDSVEVKRLNQAAIEELSQVKGVLAVFPEDTFPVRVKFGDKSASATAEAIPALMGDIVAEGEMQAGRFFLSDSANEVVIHPRLLAKLGVEDADSIIGLEISIISAKLDLSSAMGMFSGRKGPAPFKEVAHKFTVCGVRGKSDGMSFDLKQLIIPYESAQNIERLGFSSAFDLLSKVTGNGGKDEYSTLTVRMKSADDFEEGRDAIEALNYRTFSFADQFAEMKKVFLVFDLILAVVGFIALVVASLGIVNTMVMSIIERYREIGILKSLGAGNGEIRLLFLTESSVIGFTGSIIGLFFGWIISRAGSIFAKYMMVKEGGPAVDFFYLPIWLIILAILFGTLVALAAGLYPSARAARVDPVQSLRHD